MVDAPGASRVSWLSMVYCNCWLANSTLSWPLSLCMLKPGNRWGAGQAGQERDSVAAPRTAKRATATSFPHKAKSGVTGWLSGVEWVPLKLLEHLPQTPVVTNIKFQLLWFWRKKIVKKVCIVHSNNWTLWHNSQNSSTPWHGEWLC